MAVQINIDADTTRSELLGIKALVLSLLGETAMAAIPVPPVASGDLPAPVVVPQPPAATPEPPANTPQPPLASDALIDQAAAAALAAQAGPMPPPPPGVEVDSAGLPHDLRIHSAEKTKNKDSTWRYKRGTDKALIAQVEAELKQAMAAAPAPDPVIPAVTDPAAAFGGGAPTPAAPPPPAATDTPQPPVPTAPAPATGAPAPEAMAEFARVMRNVVAKQAAGGLTTEATNAIAVSLGLASIRDLAHRPDLIPAFEALLP